MNVTPTDIPGVLVIEPRIFDDARGWFFETYHKRRYADAGIDADFVQDNQSFSVRGTLRGLHYQYPHSQAKLVSVMAGTVFDVAVDIRRGSPTFGKWVGVELSGGNKRQLFIPAGLAHGFCVTSETAHFAYKCSDFYAPDCEKGVLWSDPDLGIEWPVDNPVLSDKDTVYPKLAHVPAAALPPFGGSS